MTVAIIVAMIVVMIVAMIAFSDSCNDSGYFSCMQIVGMHCTLAAQAKAKLFKR